MITKIEIRDSTGAAWHAICTPVGKSQQHGAGWHRWHCSVMREGVQVWEGETAHDDHASPIGLIARLHKQMTRKA